MKYAHLALLCEHRSTDVPDEAGEARRGSKPLLHVDDYEEITYSDNVPRMPRSTSTFLLTEPALSEIGPGAWEATSSGWYVLDGSPSARYEADLQLWEWDDGVELGTWDQ